MDTQRALPPLDLSWNPLVFVLGQVVISAVLRIEDYVPDLQERFRRNGYPIFNRFEAQTVNVSEGGPVEVGREKRWVFSDKRQAKSIVVGSSFFVLQVSEYSTFESFVEELHSTLTIFGETVSPDLYQRVGFRRINLLEDAERLSLEDSVRAELHGLGEDVFSGDHEQRLEHWGDTEVGRMMVRLMRPAPLSVVPPEIATLGLKLRGPSAQGRKTATLDIDHFLVDADDFDVDDIVRQFWRLHGPSDNAFRNSVTTEALKIWQRGSRIGVGES